MVDDIDCSNREFARNTPSEKDDQYKVLIAAGFDKEEAATVVIESIFAAIEGGRVPSDGDYLGLATALKEKPGAVKQAKQALLGIFRKRGGQRAGGKGKDNIAIGARNHCIAIDGLVQGMTQEAIAEKYDLDPKQVGRILKSYRQNDVVMAQLRMHLPKKKG